MKRGFRAAFVLILVTVLSLPFGIQLVRADDVTPPQLVSFDFSPKTVSVLYGSQTVVFTLRATDDLSGVGAIVIWLTDPSGHGYGLGFEADYCRISGDALDGVYQISRTIPQGSEGGSWTVAVSLEDKTYAWNTRSYSTQDLANLGFPSTIQVISIEDVVAPQLVSFDFTPQTADTRFGSQTVVFTLRVVDDLSGVNGIVISLLDPSGHGYGLGFQADRCRVSGDALDGVYQVSRTIPQYSKAGTWTVSVSLEDKAYSWNTRSYSTQDLAGMGFPNTIQVLSIEEDVTPPRLVNLNFEPKTVDIQHGSQTVVFTLRVVDDLSGVNGIVISLLDPSGHGYGLGFEADYCRISGDALDGVYQISRTIPQGSEGGSWTVAVSLEDKTYAWNTRSYSTQDLASLGFPTTIQVNSVQGDLPPSAPQNFAADPVVKGIRLTWTAPSSIGSSPIQTYRIYRGTSPGTETLYSSTDATATEYKDMRVSADSLYYYYIKAVNSAGESPASPEVKCSSQESIKGIENVVRLDSFKTRGIFTIQQNLWIEGPSHTYWAQNTIFVWPLTNQMSGAFEIYDFSPGHLPVPLNKVVFWQFTITQPSDFKNTLTLRSGIDGNNLIMKNDFASFTWNQFLSSDYFIRTYGLFAPEIVIVGNPINPQASFGSPTNGHSDSYVMVGSEPGTWLHGNNTVIRSPDNPSTAERSRELQWYTNGDFHYSSGWNDQGLRFGPNYEENLASPPNVPYPASSLKKSLIIHIDCPASLSLYDSFGRHTGYNISTGSVDEQIPDTICLFSSEEQFIVVFDHLEDYELLVIGTGDGTYNLQVQLRNDTGSISTIWTSSGTTSKDIIQSYTISTLTPQPFVVQWEYTFEDPKRHTILRISTDDKLFQFVAPGKDFGVKYDPKMKVISHFIIICYGDSKMSLVATAVDDRIDYCSAVASDKQTHKCYLLIDKPN